MTTNAIVLTIDDNYVLPASVLIASIAKNSRDSAPIVVVDCGLSDEGASSLVTLGEALERPVVVRRAKDHLRKIDMLPIGEYFTSATWARLLIPDICTDFSRCLYIDADCIVLQDLSTLIGSDLDECATGAVPDVFHPELAGPVVLPGYRHPGPERILRYFNAGVLLLDVNRWWEHDIASRVLRFARANQNHLRFYDQDALNAVIAGHWKVLPSKWNVPPIRDILSTLKFNYLGAEHLAASQFSQAESEAAILHFVTELKPWKRGYPRSAHRDEYHLAVTEISDAGLLPMRFIRECSAFSDQSS